MLKESQQTESAYKSKAAKQNRRMLRSTRKLILFHANLCNSGAATAVTASAQTL